MCLTKVLTKDNIDLTGFGFKSFSSVVDNKAKSMYFNHEMDKWITAEYISEQMSADDNNYYNYGFHIFLNRLNAELYRNKGVVRPVLYKGLTCIGTQERGIVVVANEICVLSKDYVWVIESKHSPKNYLTKDFRTTKLQPDCCFFSRSEAREFLQEYSYSDNYMVKKLELI